MQNLHEIHIDDRQEFVYLYLRRDSEILFLVHSDIWH